MLITKGMLLISLGTLRSIYKINNIGVRKVKKKKGLKK